MTATCYGEHNVQRSAQGRAGFVRAKVGSGMIPGLARPAYLVRQRAFDFVLCLQDADLHSTSMRQAWGTIQPLDPPQRLPPE